MLAEIGKSPSLPPHHAFVVQLAADVSIETSRIVGRVEHVVSGRVGHFVSWEALLDFMSHVLREIDHWPRSEPPGAI